MFKRHVLIAFVLVNAAFAADTTERAKPESSSVPAGKSTDAKAVDSKAAAPLIDQDNARTHHRPSFSYQPQPIPYVQQYVQPVVYSQPSYATHYAQPSYQYSQPASYYYSKPSIQIVQQPSVSYVKPSYSYVQSAPVHVAAPVHTVAAPVHTVAAAPTVSQTTITKPVVSLSQQVVQKPAYIINQQVIHKPVISEELQVIRRPIIAEVQEVIHKPSFAELVQIIKNPTYTQHIVKKPEYNSYSSEVQAAPVVLGGEQYHVVTKPQSQIIQLPTQHVQPITTEVVQVPVVQHQTQTINTIHAPVQSVGYGIGSGYGISSGYGYGSGISSGYGIGSGYGISSGYGSGISSGYGSSYGISSGYGSGYGSGYESSYITPSLECKAGGDCDKPGSGQKDLVSSMISNMQPQQQQSWQIQSVPMTYNMQPAAVQPQPMPINYGPYLKNQIDQFGNPMFSQPEQTPAGKSSGESQPHWFGYPQMQLPQGEETNQAKSINEKMAEALLDDPRFNSFLKEIYDKVQTEPAKTARSSTDFEDLKSRFTKLSQPEQAKLMKEFSNETQNDVNKSEKPKTS